MTRTLAVLFALALVVGACQAGASPTPSPTEQPTEGPTAAPTEQPPATPDPNDLLAVVKARGKILVSTDPEYPPQSELLPDGTYQGFDIDVALEIGKRLGVEVEFVTPGWDVITAGGWGGRWDISVGSMTITTPRQQVIDFSPPYYFTPAQMATYPDSGIASVADLAGKTICTGVATTYYDWAQATLDMGDQPIDVLPPAGIQVVTLTTDRNCAEQWQAGRFDFEGWLSSSTTVADAIADGLPVVEVGSPVFFEALAVAVDKSGPPHAEFMRELSAIVFAMHADDTLSELSVKWFGVDLSTRI
jgi:polar amino acid transport system substrate-binding protein